MIFVAEREKACFVTVFVVIERWLERSLANFNEVCALTSVDGKRL